MKHLSDETYSLVKETLLNMRMFDTPLDHMNRPGEIEEAARLSLRKAIAALYKEEQDIYSWTRLSKS